ncbi:DUF1697 domain-containing protein [Variovorax sp. NFACC27]|uniref:DUF1697 domain-containing protein n=1 Tax=unclassified Variovorax TaxID=663243 RepID=UPI00089771F6|nr:Uncharacterized conserved protein, DUF1697 family [Variovorax sp. NFACC28]SEG31674.1 Uncharacterized conserved protein, DUF1697 family [Variovorax sp. NFACC29]SFC40091.1 Uncharacterized conserved protein, DUF1697 family [Variovorax sp. NFACC26]SFF89928.1 Uncharacterized conserved protein, DUF1697 family [Variovorax sp. NFACC27]
MASSAKKKQAAVRHVALLRGVNVNGITIKSADLKALFVELGFGAVRTVLASGNVLFDTDESDAAALRTRIEQALRKRFGYDAWIVLLTQKTVAEMASGYPFERIDEERHPYIVFGSDAAMLDEIVEKAGTVDAGTEQLKRGKGVLYWQCPRGESLETPVAKLLGKVRYKTSTTTRNLRTVEKLLGD